MGYRRCPHPECRKYILRDFDYCCPVHWLGLPQEMQKEIIRAYHWWCAMDRDEGTTRTLLREQAKAIAFWDKQPRNPAKKPKKLKRLTR